jgi:hypothetical protein
MALVSALLAPALSLPGFSQDQGAFLILKNLEQRKLSESLELVRQAQRCVDAARNLRSLHDCHRQERDREWEQRERFRRQIETVRARYGLRRPGDRPPPPPGPF